MKDENRWCDDESSDDDIKKKRSTNCYFSLSTSPLQQHQRQGSKTAVPAAATASSDSTNDSSTSCRDDFPIHVIDNGKVVALLSMRKSSTSPPPRGLVTTSLATKREDWIHSILMQMYHNPNRVPVPRRHR